MTLGLLHSRSGQALLLASQSSVTRFFMTVGKALPEEATILLSWVQPLSLGHRTTFHPYGRFLGRKIVRSQTPG